MVSIIHDPKREPEDLMVSGALIPVNLPQPDNTHTHTHKHTVKVEQGHGFDPQGMNEPKQCKSLQVKCVCADTQLAGAGVQVLLQDGRALLQTLIVAESEEFLQDGQRVLESLQLLLQRLQLPRIRPHPARQRPQGATLRHAPAQILWRTQTTCYKLRTLGPYIDRCAPQVDSSPGVETSQGGSVETGQT